MSGGGAFILFLFLLLCWIAVSAWATGDADRRGHETPILFGLLVFFGGVIGLVLHFILRKPKSTYDRRDDHRRGGRRR